jgi:hypothetical protein
MVKCKLENWLNDITFYFVRDMFPKKTHKVGMLILG